MTIPRSKTFSVQIDTKTALLAFISISQLLNSYLVWKTQQDVQTVHIATNSMKDALVAAAKVQGRIEGRAEQKQETSNQKEQ